MLTRRETLKAVGVIAAMGPAALAVRKPKAKVRWVGDVATFRERTPRSMISQAELFDRVGSTNSDRVVLNGQAYPPGTLMIVSFNSGGSAVFVTWMFYRFEQSQQPKWVTYDRNGVAVEDAFALYKPIPFNPILATLTPVR